MSWRLLGIGASPGKVVGRVRWVRPEIPRVPHRSIGSEEVDAELQRFRDALEGALERTRQLRRVTLERLGENEARIFDPQILMLQDPDLVAETEAYIRENLLAAERAFDWRLLEVRSAFLDTGHVMVIDRLADLEDVRIRVLRELSDGPDPSPPPEPGGGARVLAFRELTPGLAVGLDPEAVLALLTVGGTRASHAAVLARSLGLPAVVGIGEGLGKVQDGHLVMLDGSTGRIVVDPDETESRSFRAAQERGSRRRERLEGAPPAPPVTADGRRVFLHANLDRPEEAAEAARLGAEGVGLFRSEFVVLGRRRVPTEEEQYRAYRSVVEVFGDRVVTLRTFDVGGDKFPIFLTMPPEENPYLGWRAIRVCLDRPHLFRNQLRAALRAARHGRLRILLPFVTSVEEVRAARRILLEVGEPLEDVPDVPLGAMIEVPAAVETIDHLASSVDFLSLGTNDLTQYVVAVDRGNARLADRYEPMHPALVRLYDRVHRAASRFSLEVSVCGALASEPEGLALLLGLGYRSFSLPPVSLPEVRDWVRRLDTGRLEEICGSLEGVESGAGVRAAFRDYLEEVLPEEMQAAVRLSKPD